jgi:predicted AlkP superfamily pyrophosphatase or phosphodiesterase
VPATPLIVVGIDGFRADYLDRPAATRLRQLAARGVRAERLVPVFPSKTFPNLFTIATGLYPEQHGIVGHAMVDPAIGRFILADTIGNRDPRWWQGEPIWITAVKQGRRSATMFWPGSEVPFGGLRASYWRSFDPAVTDEARVDQVLRWLALPADSAPALVTLYFSRVDVAGHRRGPDGAAIDSAIADVDAAIGRLVDGLAAIGRAGRVNLLVVSDHGMTEISPDRVIYLDDYVALARDEIVDLAPVTTIDPRPGRLDSVYSRLIHAHPRLSVYRRAEVPDRFRFRRHPRISPLVAVADDRWSISTREWSRTHDFTDRGNHGYDPELPSMAALCLAIGPAFRSNAVVPAFRNLHLYPLMAAVLGLRPAPTPPLPADGRRHGPALGTECRLPRLGPSAAALRSGNSGLLESP